MRTVLSPLYIPGVEHRVKHIVSTHMFVERDYLSSASCIIRISFILAELGTKLHWPAAILRCWLSWKFSNLLCWDCPRALVNVKTVPSVFCKNLGQGAWDSAENTKLDLGTTNPLTMGKPLHLLESLIPSSLCWMPGIKLSQNYLSVWISTLNSCLYS